jgi:DNA transposition AAA+ family ATPase
MKTVTSVLMEISKAIGRGEDACRSDTLTRRISETFRFGDLLIVDEAHDLEIDALNMIRHFHDTVGIGLAYLGNDEVHTRINGRGRKAAMLGPLASRVGVRCHIPHPRREDVTTMLCAWNVKGAKETEIGLQIGQGRGGLRSLTQVLRQATAIAKSRNSSLDHRAMRDAAVTFGNF